MPNARRSRPPAPVPHRSARTCRRLALALNLLLVTNYHGIFSGFQIGDIFSRDPMVMATFGANRGARIRDITDGTSNTMIMAEYLSGTENDFRGHAFSDQPAGAQLYTELTPNSRVPDRCFPTPDWCENRPEQNLPAIQGDGFTTDTAGARSRHTGGVHVLLGDGSVRFVSENINVLIWRGLATIRGSEVLGEF